MTDGAGDLFGCTDTDGLVRTHVHPEEGSVWLGRTTVADLCGAPLQNATQHVHAIDDEPSRSATCKSFLHVRGEAQP